MYIYTCDNTRVYLSVLPRMRMFQTNLLEKIKTQFLCQEPIPENRAFYEVI